MPSKSVQNPDCQECEHFTFPNCPRCPLECLTSPKMQLALRRRRWCGRRSCVEVDLALFADRSHSSSSTTTSRTTDAIQRDPEQPQPSTLRSICLVKISITFSRPLSRFPITISPPTPVAFTPPIGPDGALDRCTAPSRYHNRRLANDQEYIRTSLSSYVSPDCV